jgi:choline kinase
MGGETPKTLLPVGDHEPLLYYILSGLAAAGVDDLLVVTGHRPGEVQEYVSAHSSISSVTSLRNSRFASWGNFHSVRIALDQSPGMNVLVVNSDVVVYPDVYRSVAETRGDLVLAVERRRVLDAEDMRVQLSGDRLLAIGKDLRMPLSHGEYAGVSLLRPRAAAMYSEISTDLEWRADTNRYYEDVYETMLQRGVDGHAAFVPEGQYAEVDTPEDVPVAAAVIASNPDAWPAPAEAGSEA